MSVQMRLIAAVVRLRMKPEMASLKRVRQRIDAPKTSAEPPAAVRKRHRVTSRTVNGFEVVGIRPLDGAFTRTVLFLHGGAYVGRIAPQHYTLLSRLVDAGVRVEVPIYGLAPHHTAREAHELIAAVYRDLVDDLGGADGITVMGDSAGGGLALAVVQQLRDLDLPDPGSVLLISPWLDIELVNPDVPAAERRDPWLASVGLREAGRVWAGDMALSDPRVSPINGRLTDLPPIEIWCGDRDLLYPDVLVLTDKVAAAGGTVRLTTCPGAIHVYPILPAPEGRLATLQIIASLVGNPPR